MVLEGSVCCFSRVAFFSLRQRSKGVFSGPVFCCSLLVSPTGFTERSGGHLCTLDLFWVVYCLFCFVGLFGYLGTRYLGGE
jgi:hypothetical protein